MPQPGACGTGAVDLHQVDANGHIRPDAPVRPGVSATDGVLE